MPHISYIGLCGFLLIFFAENAIDKGGRVRYNLSIQFVKTFTYASIF